MTFKRITTPSEMLLWFRLAAQRRRHLEQARARRGLAAQFGDVRTCCLFIGHPRSGHSLVGSLIDAHPDAVMAHRLDILKQLDAGIGRAEVFFMAMCNAEAFGRRGRGLTGYAYAVPDRSQGRCAAPRLVGDQEGEKTAQRLHRDPALLGRAADALGVRLRFVHVVRNPFDNITTIALRAYRGLDYAIGRYAGLCEAIAAARERIGSERLLHVRYETLLAERGPGVERLFAFLDLPVDGAFVSDCCAIVYPQPHRSRSRMAWSEARRSSVLRLIERHPFLQGYGFEDA